VGGTMELVCVATGQGLVHAQGTGRELRRAIVGAFAGLSPPQEVAIQHLEVVPSNGAEFENARAAHAGTDKVRDESAFHLMVQCGAATSTRMKVLNRQARSQPASRRRSESSGGGGPECTGPVTSGNAAAGCDRPAVAGPPRAVANKVVAPPTSAPMRILEYRSPTGQSAQELMRVTEE
jgi:hypothetical protein